MTGRVLQVNSTTHGVPRKPVAQARVTPLGLEGDRHTAPTVHGGPHRAISLFAIEALRRVADEGHPIFPGSVGENLTTEGIEIALLPTGTRLAVGDEVLLEVTKPAMPCDLIEDSFRDRRSGRISILRFPTDSRMYARVLRTGIVRPGDAIVVLPPADDTNAHLHRQLDLFDSVEREAYLTLWRSLAAAGTRVEILDDGELVVGATPSLPASAFNRAFGLRQLPHLLDRILAMYERAGTTGWLLGDEAPWRDAVPGAASTIYAAPTEVIAASLPTPVDGLVVCAVVDGRDAHRWAHVLADGFEVDPDEARAWSTLAPILAHAPGERLSIAELDGEAVGAAALFMRRKVGLLAASAVRPGARGRGVQKALIAERVRHAIDAHAEWLVVTAVPGSVSSRNLEAMGFERLWDRRLWRYDPVVDRTAAMAAARDADA